MPALGFLKKIRSKEQRDSLTSSPITSPITPTSSRGFEKNSISTQSSNPLGQSTTQSSAAPINHETPAVAGEQKPMAEEVAQQKQTSAAASGNTPSTEHHGVMSSINNLIHTSHHDSSHHNTASTTAGATASLGGSHTHHVQQTPQQPQVRQTKGKYTLADFELQRTLGTGSFGRVHLVKSNHNQRFYAVKVLKKAQVVKMKQVEHTNDERRMLQEVKHPFLITLWGTFQDSKNLYMVMDFVEGGELFSLLRKSQVGCFHPISNCPC
jgi:protein kinase A